MDRRGFLGAVFTAGAWVLGANILSGSAGAAASWQPSVYLGFEPDGTVVITAHRSEMGTGSRTSLPLVVADELDVDWKNVRVEQAIGDKRYGSQNTDGSCSVRDFVDAMHQAGATARLMLERAAAQQWNVPAGEVAMKNGVVTHAASNRRANIGDLLVGRRQAPHSQEGRSCASNSLPSIATSASRLPWSISTRSSPAQPFSGRTPSVQACSTLPSNGRPCTIPRSSASMTPKPLR